MGYHKMLLISFYDLVGQWILTNHTILIPWQKGFVNTLWIPNDDIYLPSELTLFWAQIATKLSKDSILCGF